MLQKFTTYFKTNNLQPDKIFLLAVSGGVDSVVLCELFKQANIPFSIAHCNFGLRGAESERDEAFVKSLREKYAVPVYIKNFDTEKYAAENKLSVQEAARELRYNWFEEKRKEIGAAFTVVAHHADDNIETLLLNFFRGTGLQGLTAIPTLKAQKNFILRPLINFRRNEIIAFAKENNLDWVEDSSNSSNKYTRNFFRNELIPAIQKTFPQAEENLLNNIDRFKKINELYQIGVDDLKKKLCKKNGAEVRIPVKELMKYQHTSLIYEIIKDYGFGEKQVEEVIKLVDSESGKFIENENWQIIKHRHWFIVAAKIGETETMAIDAGKTEVRFTAGTLEIQIKKIEKISIDASKNIAQLDASNIEFPLLLRKWKEGDYFYPLGMKKKKKLSRFFIDQKFSKSEKEKTWIIESNKKIIWVVNHRIDDRFKLLPSTKEVVNITFSANLL